MTTKPTITSGIKGFIEICVDRITRQGRAVTRETLGHLHEDEKDLLVRCLASVNPNTYEIGNWCEIIDPPERCPMHTRYDGEGDRPEQSSEARCKCHLIWDWRHQK